MILRPRRRVFLAGALPLVLAACGFQPLYGEQSGQAAVGDQLALISVDVIGDRSGQILRTNLIERLTPAGRPTSPRYRLSVTLSERLQRLGIQTDATATRASLVVVSRFELTDAATGERLTANSVNSVTSYNILDDEFATLSAERAARDRALKQTSDEIRLLIALFFARTA